MILLDATILGWLLAAALCGAALPSFAQDMPDQNRPAARVAVSGNAAAVEAYIRARRAYEDEATAYWQSVVDKRRGRNAKRRNNEAITLNDYVLTQPPIYTGPPRPPGYVPPRRDPEQPALPIPGIADFLKAAAAHYNFVPDRPKTEMEFKQAYAKAAAAAGLTKDQAVRIYAFETGGNGTYDGQAGIVGNRKDARPISPAMGYNQLLSTNTVSLLAEHGDKFVAALNASAEALGGPERKAFDHKIAALRKMIAFSRTVPNAWSEHDKLAKTTQGGMGIHAAVLDRDIGPLLQTQKLLNSVLFAKMKGYMQPLTAAELELMNFTGDGNGFDLRDDAAGVARTGADVELLPARRLRAQPDRAADRHGRGAVHGDRDQDGPRLAVAGREGAGRGVLGRWSLRCRIV